MSDGDYDSGDGFEDFGGAPPADDVPGLGLSTLGSSPDLQIANSVSAPSAVELSALPDDGGAAQLQAAHDWLTAATPEDQANAAARYQLAASPPAPTSGAGGLDLSGGTDSFDNPVQTGFTPIGAAAVQPSASGTVVGNDPSAPSAAGLGSALGVGSPSASTQPTPDQVALARLIYAEADEKPEQQTAVGWAINNRVGRHDFAPTLQGVINQPLRGPAGGYEFQALVGKKYADAANPDSITGANRVAYDQALQIAGGILHGDISDPTHGATYFYSNGPSPFFRRRLDSLRFVPLPTGPIGNTTFIYDTQGR